MCSAAAGQPSYDTMKVLKIPALRGFVPGPNDRYYRGAGDGAVTRANFVNNNIFPRSNDSKGNILCMGVEEKSNVLSLLLSLSVIWKGGEIFYWFEEKDSKKIFMRVGFYYS